MVSIVIPVYNAEEIIYNTYQTLTKKLEEIEEKYELLFRNDGSRDQSQEALVDIACKDNRVRVFSHNPNMGLGFTLRKLFDSARGEIIVYLDADLSFGVDVLPRFLKEIHNTDVVLASRYTGLKGKIPLNRKFMGRLYYLFSKFLFNIDIKDIGSGFVMFKRDIFDKVRLSSNGFDIHIEFFAKIKNTGLSVKEIPVGYIHNHESSTFKVLKHGPNIILNTLRVWWKIKTKRN